MKYSVSKYIKKLEKREKLAKKALKVLGLELKGHLKRNISEGRITPKTVKPKGKTLYDTGAGLKNIGYSIAGNKLKFGNFLKYFGYHIKGTKNLPKRNWLFWSDEAKKVIRTWIADLWK